MTPLERMYPTQVPSSTVDAGVSAVFAEFEAETWRSSALREVVGVVAVAVAPVAPVALVTVWELRHGRILSGSSIGLYLTREDAVAAAEQALVALSQALARNPGQATGGLEKVWDEIVWSVFTDPDFGYTETRGHYSDQSYVVLTERTLGHTRTP